MDDRVLTRNEEVLGLNPENGSSPEVLIVIARPFRVLSCDYEHGTD